MRFFSIRRFRDLVLGAETPPQKTAMSLAIGVGLAFGPTPGLHWILAFILMRVLKLNSFVTIAGTLFHNPWTAIPIHLFGLIVGDICLTGHMQSIQQFDAFPWAELGLNTVFSGDFWQENSQVLYSFIKPFLLGSTINAVAFAFIGYYITLRYVRRFATRIPAKKNEESCEPSPSNN